jgi:predicted RNase H-like HicB family nuclease
MESRKMDRPKRQELRLSNYTFTAFFVPVWEPEHGGRAHPGGKRRAGAARSAPRCIGYQVTVPVLPGLITYVRTLDEARRMAVDAVRCHLDGMRKAGEEIPGEAGSRTEKLRVALTA